MLSPNAPRHSFWLNSLPYLLFGFLAVIYLIVIPTGESPDEPSHLRCIEQVSVQKRLPFVDPPSGGEVWWHPEAILSGYVCYHMPLYYLMAGGTQLIITAVTHQPSTYQFPPHNYDFGPQANLFEHSQRKPSPWQITDPGHIVGLRLLSIILSGLVVWSTIQITRYLVPEQTETAVIAGLIVAGWPQFVYFSRSINNDILATALALLILVGLLNVGKPNRYPLLAFLSTLALLTKLTTAFTIVVLLIAWSLEAWQQRKNLQPYLKNLALCIIIWSIAGLFIFFQPTINQNVTYGLNYLSWFPERIKTSIYWLDVAKMTLSSGWVRFAWMNLAVPMGHAYGTWLIVGSLVTIGGGYILQKSQRVSTNRLFTQILILIVWVGSGLASYIRINMTHFQPQFRFIFVLLPVIIAIGTIGLNRLNIHLPKPVTTPMIIFFIIATWLGYNAWVISTLVIPGYYGQ